MFNTIYEKFYDAFLKNQGYLTYLEGTLTTLKISFFAVVLGIIIGIIVAVVKHFAKDNKFLKPLEWLCNIYVNVIRGTPVMLQITMATTVIFTARFFTIDIVAIITFGINSGAYVSEIIRGGINSIEKGQTEAGRSLGLSNVDTMRFIVMPQAIKNILPALGNEFIQLVKETAIVGAFAATDLTKVGTIVQFRTYDMFTPLLICGVIYLIIVLGLTKLLAIFERSLNKSDIR